MVVSECTGIFIESLCADTSNILTSANLVGSLQDGLTDNVGASNFPVLLFLAYQYTIILFTYSCRLKCVFPMVELSVAWMANLISSMIWLL
jgi:hypothetical protein